MAWTAPPGRGSSCGHSTLTAQSPPDKLNKGDCLGLVLRLNETMVAFA